MGPVPFLLGDVAHYQELLNVKIVLG